MSKGVVQDREFLSAECLMPSCEGRQFPNKEAAKAHMEDTKHSVVTREHVVTIWRA